MGTRQVLGRIMTTLVFAPATLILSGCGTSDPSSDTTAAIIAAQLSPQAPAVAQCNNVAASSYCDNNLNPTLSSLSTLQTSCTAGGGTWVENVRCASDTSTVGACVSGSAGTNQVQRVYYNSGGSPYTNGPAQADCVGRGGTWSPTYTQ